jgi:hypothetical protein
MVLSQLFFRDFARCFSLYTKIQLLREHVDGEPRMANNKASVLYKVSVRKQIDSPEKEHKVNLS